MPARLTGVRILAGIAIVVAVLVVIGWMLRDTLLLALMSLTMNPDVPFDPAAAPPAPDYADDGAWAALPARADGADAVPPGFSDGQAGAPVDLFFVHPTTLLTNDHWNQPLDRTETNLLTDDFVLRHQASAFNGCCRVFAPRYRQATLYAFIDDTGNGAAALALAYEDVRAAFRQFIAERAGDRPFLVAGHSQGSRHLEFLLADEISDTPLMERFVGAWPIGFYLDRARVAAALPDIPVCSEPGETGCITTWNAVGPEVEMYLDVAGSICVNPLTGRNDDAHADFDANPGALPYALAEEPLPALQPAVADAQCVDGLLQVSDIRGEGFGLRPLGADNYHIYDYGLYWEATRRAVELQVRNWLAAEAAAPAPASI